MNAPTITTGAHVHPISRDPDLEKLETIVNIFKAATTLQQRAWAEYLYARYVIGGAER